MLKQHAKQLDVLLSKTPTGKEAEKAMKVFFDHYWALVRITKIAGYGAIEGEDFLQRQIDLLEKRVAKLEKKKKR